MSDGVIIPSGMDTEVVRRDPYRNMNFLVIIEGVASAGFKEVEGLSHSTEVVTYREGGDNTIERKSPGRTTWDPIILRRGLTLYTDVYEWARQTVRLDGPADIDSVFRKNINIVLRNKTMMEVYRWAVYNCWISRYVIPTFDAMANEIILEEIQLEHEGWELVQLEGAEYALPDAVTEV